MIEEVSVDMLVLNRDGLKHALIAIQYDELISIEAFEGEISNPLTGKTTSKLKLKDLNDISIISNFSIFEDNRVKYFEPNAITFPVRVKYSFKRKYLGNLFVPGWIPIPNYQQKVEKTTFRLQFPQDLPLRYLEKNIPVSAQESVENNMRIVSWQLADLDVQEDDFPKEDDLSIKVAPTRFSMQGYESDLSTWNGLGQWILKLNNGRSEISERDAKWLRENIKEDEEPFQKIKLIYEYMQKNNRYVSIQLGIGGWQPMSAKEVSDLNYGDCKALTNYMMAMLKAVNITSNYTLVKAGSDEEDIDIDFPSNQFNHAILSVPMERDTLWLECTSNVLNTGFLGSFTSNRHVLLVNETGGHLVKTPIYGDDVYHSRLIDTKIDLLDNGNAEIEQERKLFGFAAEDYLAIKLMLNEEETKKYIYDDLSIQGLYINDFQLNVNKDGLIPEANIKHNSVLNKYYTSTGKRIIIKPKFDNDLPFITDGQSIEIKENYQVRLNQNVSPEQLKSEVILEEEGIIYKYQAQLSDDLLSCKRTIKITNTNHNKEAWKKIVDRIKKLDDQTIIFTKNQ
ncbi:DUF3857 domain-containing protein [Penaeicola halotolerans]|uniref:DUF3857 domain-containing protein n=1 Tax=Penaeicola halotolerans TaxID=2793196 RepID=UPI001CF859E3|nr:DUF3857 domain-containing protein [Penaeicola halotolerans]